MAVGVFINAPNWHYWHHCQLCMPIYFQFPSLFAIKDVKIDANRCKRIIFQGCLHWSNSFLMVSKMKLANRHSYIVESLQKSSNIHVCMYVVYCSVVSRCNYLRTSNAPLIIINYSVFERLLPLTDITFWFRMGNAYLAKSRQVISD